MQNNKKDYLIAAVAALITVAFLTPMIKNVKIGGGMIVYALFAVVPVCWVFGIWLGRFLARWLKFMKQFARFVVVGFLNTAIDFGILNILSIVTGVVAGIKLGSINIVGFAIAALNSYFWNKHWVFQKEVQEAGPIASPQAKPGESESGREKPAGADVLPFIAVAVTGALINSGIVALLTCPCFTSFLSGVPVLGGMDAQRWLNVAKACATAFVLVWNFIGMKIFVFKR